MRDFTDHISNADIKDALVEFVSVVEGVASSYAGSILLWKIFEHTNVKDLFSKTKVRLSNNFSPEATTLIEVDSIEASIKAGDYLQTVRRQALISLGSALELATAALGNIASVPLPPANLSMTSPSGTPITTKVLRHLYAIEAVHRTGSVALDRHSYAYLENAYVARNCLVHENGKASQRLLLCNPSVWKISDVGDKIIIDDNKIDDIIQFLDRSFLNIFRDLDAKLP